MAANPGEVSSLSPLIQKWLEWDQDPTTRAEIEQLRDAGELAELRQRLHQRIQFGTAGLRGRMAAGFSCMNALTVIQASQGLAMYLKKQHGDIASYGVVIGHDARYNSAKFAALAANAFIAQRIPVWFYSEPSVTPTVPFGVTQLHAAAGIMITASHNPAQDNGYKVYFKNGAQINSPMDAEISQSIEENVVPWPDAWKDPQPGEYLRANAYDNLLLHYNTAVWQYAVGRRPISRSTVLTAPQQTYTVREWKQPQPFVYTPLHGVGGLVFPGLCRSVGINDFTVVPEQEHPNPDFPTVAFPNPEETGALDLAMKTADKEGKSLIVAHDPDADRFAAAEKVDGSWFIFTGNHLGVLLASHLFDSLETIDSDTRIAVLNSAVSTSMLEKMAVAKGMHYEEALTGFKWMGNIARKLEELGYYVPFAFEEALGYMFPEVCYDKDGISAAMVFLLAEAKWKAQGLTPYGKLQQLFREHGHHETLNTYVRSPNTDLTMNLFRAIRAGPFSAGKSFGSFKILRWRDLTEYYDSGTEDHKPTLPADKSSQMLTLWLDRGVRFTIRSSGTEPKVKVYIESSGASREEAVDAVRDTFLTVLNEWVQPFAPSMTSHKQQTTSSGHVFKVD
ncbi:phosphoglucomutase [Aspergillus ellipticus CBS 707.79]|uniref:Phosphoglucomutase n=1 Tax=Aspergillus ellipticus CBS 707.79 TaxID=1448320 RepID=A0A319DHU1_9EURO|nr:phosphoglucomutase [Aspergillus ellipticus CBS 707.79]